MGEEWTWETQELVDGETCYIALKWGEEYILSPNYAMASGGAWIDVWDNERADLIAHAPALQAETERLKALNVELLGLVHAALPTLEGSLATAKPSAESEYINAWCLRARKALSKAESEAS